MIHVRHDTDICFLLQPDTAYHLLTTLSVIST